MGICAQNVVCLPALELGGPTNRGVTSTIMPAAWRSPQDVGRENSLWVLAELCPSEPYSPHLYNGSIILIVRDVNSV